MDIHLLILKRLYIFFVYSIFVLKLAALAFSLVR